MFEDVTLQINLSPGDINYAHLTVPALVKKHLEIKKKLLIVDCCRPQKTKLVNPDIKFPIDVFEGKVEKIISIAEQLKYDNVISDIYYLKPNDSLYRTLSKKYLNGIYDCTHSGGGTANMSYWAAIDLPDTRYVVHYDGDVLLYQKEGYSWVKEAMKYFDINQDVITVLPRYAPPDTKLKNMIPSHQEGMDNENFEEFWLNDFFSTRNFLIDKERFFKCIPLMKGKILFETLLRKYTRRTFPRDPEIVLFKRLQELQKKRLILKSNSAWILHPNDKPKEYLELLPQILRSIDLGECPDGQRGYPNIDLSEWKSFYNAG